MAADLDSSE